MLQRNKIVRKFNLEGPNLAQFKWKFIKGKISTRKATILLKRWKELTSTLRYASPLMNERILYDS